MSGETTRLRVPRTSMRLVSGATSRDRIVELAGFGPEEIDRRLASAGGEESA